ncbi:hypothetical protein B9479_004361 [Cryptococcus floricola]|uniref:Sld7 C-terminal domain-containing protein n=1 Tax=Cryptococcus floricola TaxID=2591691 RepID=A0A5D3AXA6_9TREE|nr:hypothetical protein B9479_004361 [Cryptococcus floricola]
MTSLPAPSPSRNPFAKPALATEGASFAKSAILPTFTKKATLVSGDCQTPIEKRLLNDFGSAQGTRTSWRLLWRGGLEIGKEGWRLDGITFFAQLSFPPPTPSKNPFAFPTPPPSFSPAPSSPFHSLPGGTTDLCLSLESMRGRKYLQVRDVVDLPDGEVLEGDEDDAGSGVQVSISEQAPLLAGYVIGLLGRDGSLSANGRTKKAIVIGLGDEEVENTLKSTILVYGQLQSSLSNESSESTLRLFVGRRKPPPPPPSEKKIRPGEPLPRAPLFIPADPKKPFRPFARSFSRTSSTSQTQPSIYAPPPSASVPSIGMGVGVGKGKSGQIAPVSGRTPGRRGEKRARLGEAGREEDRKRRAGKIVSQPRLDDRVERRDREGSVRVKEERGPSLAPSEHSFRAPSLSRQSVPPVSAFEQGPGDEEGDEEDIFGKRASSMAPSMSRVSSAGGRSEVGPSVDEVGTAEASGRKRVRVPQQVLDNKASIRKQTLLLLELRGIPRTHDLFKDIFGVTTKGVYFAFRDQLQDRPVSKTDIQRIIHGHLDMYLQSSLPSIPPLPQGEGQGEALKSILEVKQEELSKSGSGVTLHLHEHGDGRVKLEAVVEEEEF